MKLFIYNRQEEHNSVHARLLLCNVTMALNFNVTLIFVVLLLSKTEANCEIEDTTKKVTCHSLNDFENSYVNEQVNWTDLVIENSKNEKLQSLKNDMFKTVQNLKVLSINGLINSIEPFAFRGLKKLETLSLEKNHIETLPENIFESLVNVKSITVKSSGLKIIQSRLFRDLNNLLYLDFMNNIISTIEDCALCNLNNVTVLLANNSIVDFEPVRILGQTSSLIGINLDDNHVKVIHRFGFMPQFRGLVIGNNSIEKIEDNAFENCPNLQLLDVSSNKLEKIQANILSKHFQQDEYFFLLIHNNKLQCVDTDLRQKIQNLRRVTVESNPWNCNCLTDIIAWATKQHAYVGCDLRGICNISCKNNNGTNSIISFNFN